MSYPKDHRDMLRHVEAPTGKETVVVKKPDWLVHDGASAPNTPHNVKKTRLGDLLVHNTHTPSGGSFTPGSAPYKEDGASVWERDGTAKKKKKLCFPDGSTQVEGDGEEEEEEVEEEEEEEEVKENDPRWNAKRRSPAKRREGEFEKDFRSRKSYSGNKADEEEENDGDDGEKPDVAQEVEPKEAEEKGQKEEKPEVKTSEPEKKVKIPKHLVSGPLW